MVTYIIFLLYLATVVGIILSVAFVIEQRRQKKQNIAAKLPYECGYGQITDSRRPINIKFIRISIRFLMFDVEVLMFLPFVFYLPYASTKAIVCFSFFVLLTTIGYLIELVRGSLLAN